MNLNNPTLKSNVEYWSNEKLINKQILEKFEPLLSIIDILSYIVPIPKMELKKFVIGILMAAFFFKYDDKTGKLDEFNEIRSDIESYLMPVLNKLIGHIKSDEYRSCIINQQITGKNIFEFDGVKGVIDIDAIILHANRIRKLILTRKDVEKIEIDFIKYNREIYSIPKPDTYFRFTTKLDQPRMKAIHQYLYEEKYIEPDEASWLYWFDLQPWLSKKKNPGRIKWNKASYHLTNVVYILCGNMAVNTEKVMERAFILQNGRHFQKKQYLINQKNLTRNYMKKWKWHITQ